MIHMIPLVVYMIITCMYSTCTCDYRECFHNLFSLSLQGEGGKSGEMAIPSNTWTACEEGRSAVGETNTIS